MTPIESAVAALRSAFRNDPGAVTHILRAKAFVGPWLADHPTIPADDDGYLSGLGLINGLLRAATGSVIAAHYSDERENFRDLVGFSVYEDPAPPTEINYRAIPMLVYVPRTEDQAADEARAVEQLRADTDLRVYLAEDFESAEVVETPEDDLSAMITATCPSI